MTIVAEKYMHIVGDGHLRRTPGALQCTNAAGGLGLTENPTIINMKAVKFPQPSVS